VAAVSLTAPEGSATVGSDVQAEGAIASASLTPPTGAATGETVVSGNVPQLWLTPPTGDAIVTAHVVATGAIAPVGLRRPTGSVVGPPVAPGVGYPNTVDFGLLVALAEGGRTPRQAEYRFGGIQDGRRFYRDGDPWYANYEEPE